MPLSSSLLFTVNCYLRIVNIYFTGVSTVLIEVVATSSLIQKIEENLGHTPYNAFCCEWLYISSTL